MTVFFKGFCYDFNDFFVIILSMKLPPQANKNVHLSPVDIMSQMQVLLSEKDDIIDKKSDVIASQKHRIEILEEYLRLAKSNRFSASSEQTPSEQGHLFNEAEDTAEPEQDELDLDETNGNDNNDDKKKTGRKTFSKNIPRHQVFAYLGFCAHPLEINLKPIF